MKSSLPLGDFTPNIGSMLVENDKRFGPANACAQRIAGAYHFWTWNELFDGILRVSKLLRGKGLVRGDRVGFVASNSYSRLIAELAVMSSGLVAVPVFVGYPGKFAASLLDFAKVKGVVVENTKVLSGLQPQSQTRVLLNLESTDFFSFPAPLGAEREELIRSFLELSGSSMALVMFTSGTSGVPKGVQLSHSNLMSQQKALQLLWKPKPQMRFLSYLPWHHSFGGLFERFFALHSGGCLAIDDSLGKDAGRLLENFGEIKPNVLFSVPKVYQEIVGKMLVDPSLEARFFHPELQFVFTAAAPLPASISDIFKAKNVPVVEGWGLTETSPCCTLTEVSTERFPGVVGLPIPGVELKLAQENEILVRGPNVMSGYLDRPEETRKVIDAEGWFSTGDVGEMTPLGLKIVSRKDRMFKLDNGEKVFPSQIEEKVKTQCKYVKHAFVWGKGRTQPLLMVMPNSEFFAATSAGHTPESTCSHPRCPADLASCLGNCLHEVNEQASSGFERIKRAVLVLREPTIENGEITPSFKLVPNAIEKNYQSYVDMLTNDCRLPPPPHAFFVEIPAPARATSTSQLRYGLIGVGPIGSVIAMHLLRAGTRLAAYCPFPDKLQLLREKPIRVKGALAGEGMIQDLYDSLGAFLDSAPDVILIATKSADSKELLKRIVKHGVSEKTVFVSCQNGLDVEDQISGYFGKSRALRMVLNLGCQPERANDVQVSFAYTNFLSDIETKPRPYAQLIAADLNTGGFSVELRRDYRAEVFKKVILNSALSPVCSLLGVTMKAAMEDPSSLGVVKALLREAIHLGNVAGVQLPSDFFEQALAYLGKGGDHKPSMAIDIEHGRKSENEDHGGKLLALAQGLGVQMPTTEVVFNLMSSLETRAMRSKQ